MNFPQLSEQRLSLPDVIIDLMKSIALEEIALSNLINAEAEKIHAFVGKHSDFPTNPSNEDLLRFNLAISRIMDTVLMKEWLLLKKLETVIQLQPAVEFEEEDEFEEK